MGLRSFPLFVARQQLGGGPNSSRGHRSHNNKTIHPNPIAATAVAINECQPPFGAAWVPASSGLALESPALCSLARAGLASKTPAPALALPAGPSTVCNHPEEGGLQHYPPPTPHSPSDHHLRLCWFEWFKAMEIRRHMRRYRQSRERGTLPSTGFGA